MLFILSIHAGYGQNDSMHHGGETFIPLHTYSYHLADRMDIRYDLSGRYLHTVVKPYTRFAIAGLADAVHGALPENARERFNYGYLQTETAEYHHMPDTGYAYAPHGRYLYPDPGALYTFFTLRINPVLSLMGGNSSVREPLLFVNTRGVEVRGDIDDKVGFYIYLTDNQARLPQYVQDRVDAAPQVTPGEGFSKIFKDDGVDYPSTHGYITFHATEHILFQFGQDKLFIGDGIRSMIWSDNSKDMLFLKIQTDIWRLQYENFFAELGNYDGSNIYNSLVHKKYAALHHLDIPITKTIHVGLFESVIFSRTNSYGIDQGFELQYLNPIIFYRAVESGLGSKDNVLLGADWKWNFLHRFSVYGQLVLDEFVFDEVFSGNGWWGNKYALQGGIKYIDAFSIPFLDLQYEYNMARPYTYSYEDDNASSYTHYAQAIAHPLGANFAEHLFHVQYQPLKKWSLENYLSLAQYGSDTSGSNWGGNIFLDYNSYETEYHNVTGQGLRNTLLLSDLRLSFQCWHNVFIDAQWIYRKHDGDDLPEAVSEQCFLLGIRIHTGKIDFLF
ncbi:MAG: hypothetical protein R2794_02470 [Chitinophagales bacterium]